MRGNPEANTPPNCTTFSALKDNAAAAEAFASRAIRYGFTATVKALDPKAVELARKHGAPSAPAAVDHNMPLEATDKHPGAVILASSIELDFGIDPDTVAEEFRAPAPFGGQPPTS